MEHAALSANTAPRGFEMRLRAKISNMLGVACLASAPSVGAMSSAAHPPCLSRYVSSSRHSFHRSRRILAQYHQLPPGWEAYQDEQGRVYYGNVQTGETRWEPPSSQYGELPPQQYQQPQYQQQHYQQPHDRHYQQPQYQQPQYQQPQQQYGGAGGDDATTLYISERLQEPNLNPNPNPSLTLTLHPVRLSTLYVSERLQEPQLRIPNPCP